MRILLCTVEPLLLDDGEDRRWKTSQMNVSKFEQNILLKRNVLCYELSR